VARSTRGVAVHILYQNFTGVARARRAHCAKKGGQRAAGRSRRALWAAQGYLLLRAATPGYPAALLSRRRRREAGGRHYGLGREARAADVGPNGAAFRSRASRRGMASLQ